MLHLRRTIAAFAIFSAFPALAQTPSPTTLPSAPAQQATPAPGPTAAQQPAPQGFWQQSNLLGDLGGLRTQLADHGVTLGLTETSEIWGNLGGGVRRGPAYDGLTVMGLGIDTAKAFGWEGGTFNVTALQIHGRNISAENLLTLQTASGIQATRATRLWEIWFQQAFLGGKLDVRIGQQSLDQEFIVSQGSSLFINTAMGWPLLPSADLYAGGPAYPLSSLGIRLRAQPASNITVLGGVFDDNPPGGPFYNDSQVRGAEQSGTKFNTNTGALFIGEVQFALGGTPPAGGGPPPGLPGTYKLGFWYDTGSFPDQRFDAARLSLADPGGSGVPRMLRHNFSLYAVMDQTVWRPDPDGPRAIGIFARIMGAPSDRNLVDASLNAGVTFKAPFPGRENNSLGLAYGYGHISGRAAALAQDTARFSGAFVPRRGSESVIELTYQAQITPWWILQPDAQYVFNPGGGIINPLNPYSRIKNEAVLGLRTSLTF